MRTLGVDLATDPANTGICRIEWSGGRARVTDLRCEAADESLAATARDVDRVGIDCPLGWPDAFVEAVAAHASGGRWPGRDQADPALFRDSLKFRATDQAVRALGLTPMSVSSSWLGVTTMRCALLLDQLGRQGADVRRDGAGLVAEVYPAAALDRWGLGGRRYKVARGRRLGASMLERLLDRAPWLEIDAADRRRCRDQHDLFDALVCALVARAVALGRTAAPPPEHAARAAREGWIHVPQADALDGLATA